jgi:hypothetical protein
MDGDACGISGPSVGPQLNLAGAPKRASRDRPQADSVPYSDSRGEGQQRAEIVSQQDEAAPAQPRHDQTNWRAGRLEPGAQRLQASAERDQTGEREGGGEGHNSPGHAPRLPGGARRAFTARTQYGTYGRVAA